MSLLVIFLLLTVPHALYAMAVAPFLSTELGRHVVMTLLYVFALLPTLVAVAIVMIFRVNGGLFTTLYFTSIAEESQLLSGRGYDDRGDGADARENGGEAETRESGGGAELAKLPPSGGPSPAAADSIDSRGHASLVNEPNRSSFFGRFASDSRSSVFGRAAASKARAESTPSSVLVPSRARGATMAAPHAPEMVAVLQRARSDRLFSRASSAARLLGRTRSRRQTGSIVAKRLDPEEVGLEFDPSIAEPKPFERKFAGKAGDLVYGDQASAATGLFAFMQVDEGEVRDKIKRGVDALREEWEAVGTEADLDNLRYVLDEEAGSSNETFQHGWKRDRGPNGALLPERQRRGGGGMRLNDFVRSKEARDANLKAAHVAALRLYTMSSFTLINDPLRQLARDDQGAVLEPPRLVKPYPLPVTLALIYESLKFLRAGAAKLHSAKGPDRSTPAAKWLLASRAAVADSSPSKATGLGKRKMTLSSIVLRAHLHQNLHSNDQQTSGGDAGVHGSGGDGSDVPPPKAQSLLGIDGGGIGGAARKPPPLPMLEKLRLRLGHALERLERDNTRFSARRAAERKRMKVLYRGMRHLVADEKFIDDGGTELAALSTTDDLKVAARYARCYDGSSSIIFRVLVPSAMQLGIDLKFLSAFPHEREYLCAPRRPRAPRSRPVLEIHPTTLILLVPHPRDRSSVDLPQVTGRRLKVPPRERCLHRLGR